MAQKVKDLVLSLQWLRSLLCCGFSPWPRNFHMPQAWPKKKKKKFKKNHVQIFEYHYIVTTILLPVLG